MPTTVATPPTGMPRRSHRRSIPADPGMPAKWARHAPHSFCRARQRGRVVKRSPSYRPSPVPWCKRRPEKPLVSHRRRTPQEDAFDLRHRRLGVGGCRFGLLGVRPDGFPFLVDQGVVDVLMEYVVEYHLAVLRDLLVGGPLRIIGAHVLGLRAHLHLLAGRLAPHLRVD